MDPFKVPDEYSDPVVIGGVGGSGTRLVAQLLENLGYFIGHDQNSANDNLWFTLLFKRIGILSSSEKEFDELVKIFFYGMTGTKIFTRTQIELINALASKDRKQHSAAWLKQRASSLLSKNSGMNLDGKWGWKEPNSHIVIDRLINKFNNLKYIHVIRNGLDMAYSSNQNQLKFWGPYFLKESFNVTPYYSLKYWCMIHKRVLNISKLMGSNFLLLNFDDFCLNPVKGIKQLCKLLKLEANNIATQLAVLVRPPKSIGRFKQHGTTIFAKEDIAYVKSLGFDVGEHVP